MEGFNGTCNDYCRNCRALDFIVAPNNKRPLHSIEGSWNVWEPIKKIRPRVDIIIIINKEPLWLWIIIYGGLETSVMDVFLVQRESFFAAALS